MPGFEIFGEEERREAMEVLETGVLMRYGFDASRKGRWKARDFETLLAKRLGASHAHLCSSGTAALTTALAACGVGAGDEVVVPPFTFVADLEAVIMAGAIPVFADIDETLCLDPAAVERAIGPRTKAVLAVHMCGAMARIDRLADLCRRRGVTLIEDVAQALGASFRGKALGTFGRASCFSFDAVKTVTCGEGGAIVTDDDEVHRLAEAFTDHGHDHLGADRGADGHEILGLNFRISELSAAIGLAQLRKLDRILETQRANHRFLRDGLASVEGLTFREIPDPGGDSATFLSFMLPTEEDARRSAKAIAAAGVDGCFYWFDNNWHYHRRWEHVKALRGAGRVPTAALGERVRGADDLEQSDAILGRTLSLAIKLSWTRAQLDERLAKLLAALAPAPKVARGASGARGARVTSGS